MPPASEGVRGRVRCPEEIKEEEKNAEAEKKKAEALKEEALSGNMALVKGESSQMTKILLMVERVIVASKPQKSMRSIPHPSSLIRTLRDVEGRPAEKVTVKKRTMRTRKRRKPKKKKSKKTEDTESLPLHLAARLLQPRRKTRLLAAAVVDAADAKVPGQEGRGRRRARGGRAGGGESH